MLASSILPQCMGEKASNHNHACPFAAGMPANSYLPPQYQTLPVTAQMQYNAAMQGYGLADLRVLECLLFLELCTSINILSAILLKAEQTLFMLPLKLE